MKKNVFFVGMIGILLAFGLVLSSCSNDNKPCSTGGKCYVNGISVSNWCKESRCTVSKAGSGEAYCDCP